MPLHLSSLLKRYYRSIFLPVWILIASLASCSKNAGYGGNASLTGVVMAHKINPVSEAIIATYPIPDERIYIVFGDDNFYGDEVRSFYDGSYRFKYLRKGAYTLYAYSFCNSCPSGTEPIFTTIEIPDNHGEYLADTLFLYQL